MTTEGRETVYLLGFRERTKIGIACNAFDRLRDLAWDHAKLANEEPHSFAVTVPTPWARQIERAVLAEHAGARLKGEYLTIDFAAARAAVEKHWSEREKEVETTSQWLGKLPSEPRLYRTKRPDTPYQVAWVRTDLPVQGIRRPRFVRWFAHEEEALEFLNVVKAYWRAGVLGEQMDAATALNLIRGCGTTLTELARDYLRARR
jgi:hypothetical protein